MRVPDPNDTRVTADEQVSTVLFPSCHDTRPSPQPQNLVEAPERADHLYWVRADSRIIVAIEPDDSVGYTGMKTKSSERETVSYLLLSI